MPRAPWRLFLAAFLLLSVTVAMVAQHSMDHVDGGSVYNVEGAPPGHVSLYEVVFDVHMTDRDRMRDGTFRLLQGETTMRDGQVWGPLLKAADEGDGCVVFKLIVRQATSDEIFSRDETSTCSKDIHILAQDPFGQTWRVSVHERRASNVGPYLRFPLFIDGQGNDTADPAAFFGGEKAMGWIEEEQSWDDNGTYVPPTILYGTVPLAGTIRAQYWGVVSIER